MTQKAVARLLKHAAEENNFNFTRDKAIIALILSSAFYAHELCTLSVKAIHLKKHQLRVVNSEEEVRVIPLDESLYFESLKNWLGTIF